jgi:hypothetical protein
MPHKTQKGKAETAGGSNFAFKKFNRQRREKTRKRKARCFQVPRTFGSMVRDSMRPWRLFFFSCLRTFGPTRLSRLKVKFLDRRQVRGPR